MKLRSYVVWAVLASACSVSIVSAQPSHGTGHTAQKEGGKDKVTVHHSYPKRHVAQSKHRVGHHSAKQKGISSSPSKEESAHASTQPEAQEEVMSSSAAKPAIATKKILAH